MQLPSFSLDGLKDTLTGFRDMIYNPENGAVFGIEFGKLFIRPEKIGRAHV